MFPLRKRRAVLWLCEYGYGKAVPSNSNILLAKNNRVKRFETRQLSLCDASSLTKFALRLELILAQAPGNVLGNASAETWLSG